MQVDGVGRTLLGDTIDDAAGEAFDKSPNCLAWPIPAGRCWPNWPMAVTRRRLPSRARCCIQGDLNFSFAGLKTAVANEVAPDRQAAGPGAVSSPQPLLPADHPRRADLAASVQARHR